MHAHWFFRPAEEGPEGTTGAAAGGACSVRIGIDRLNCILRINMQRSGNGLCALAPPNVPLHASISKHGMLG
jgi:hypothetical protein